MKNNKKSVLTYQAKKHANKQTSPPKISLSGFNHLRKLEDTIYNDILELDISARQKDKILGKLNKLLNGAEEVFSWII